MKTRLALSGVALIVVAFVLTANAFDDSPGPTKLEGIISDFSPQSTTPNGPYVVSGPWSLRFQPNGKGDFDASLTMVRSDLNIGAFGGPDSQAARNFHTHHVQITNGDVTVETVNGVTKLTMTGTVFVTGSGNQMFPGSTARVEITGGSVLTLSNVKLIFNAPASGHFTSEPYEGVVTLP
jgi:hypothetical protein